MHRTVATRATKRQSSDSSYRAMAKKKGPPKKQKASRSPQGKQRQERRDGWSNVRRQVTGCARLVCPRTAQYWPLASPKPRVSPHCSCPRAVRVPALFVSPPVKVACQIVDCPQVIKVPEGAVLRGCSRWCSLQQLAAGGWGADAAQGRRPAAGQVVLVDEHRTTRVSSAVNGKQPCEVELNTLSATRPAGWKPPEGQVE
ncbi:hypothetical protein HaLaN_14465 [Haematococcus lacustris]|uniref:Uncharacterized protein n=1 Tax=Haematococcus lacustris TaxID=44745 RepID=A0A699ZG14_HAELA|nr:hypothetical protein HaLaN_14465 [Haematococcus lacustris]